MSEDNVSRAEFNQLKEEVKAIKNEMAESSKILQAIDKKIDVIDAKMVTSGEIEALKLKPLEQQVEALKEEITTLKENSKWLKRTLFTTIGGGLFAIILEVIVYVVKIK